MYCFYKQWKYPIINDTNVECNAIRKTMKMYFVHWPHSKLYSIQCIPPCLKLAKVRRNSGSLLESRLLERSLYLSTQTPGFRIASTWQISPDCSLLIHLHRLNNHNDHNCSEEIIMRWDGMWPHVSSFHLQQTVIHCCSLQALRSVIWFCSFILCLLWLCKLRWHIIGYASSDVHCFMVVVKYLAWQRLTVSPGNQPSI